MTDKLRWGILSTGRISGVFAKGLAESSSGQLVAVASRTQEAADKFGDEYNVPHRHDSYDALLANPEVQAVYISTPHPMHAQWAVRAAQAGKHILCEKPLTMNYWSTMAVVEAARQNDVFLMEAFMYRCHPQTQKLVELIAEGAIGEVKVIQASFSFGAGFDPNSRIYNNALGGGGLLDVGCYCASMARMIAGAATGKQHSSEPIEVQAVGHVGESNVDYYTVAVLKFPGDIVAQLSTGVAVGQDNMVRIFGTGGSIVVPSPWFCGPEAGTANIIVNRNGQETEHVTVDPPTSLYAIEADTVAKYIEQRQAAWPAMTPADSLGNMKTLDLWREAIGLTYADDKPNDPPLTVAGYPLQKSASANMKYGEVKGVGKPVSRLIMGVDNQHTWPHASVMFDTYFEAGGNCFDSAYIYAGGLCEETLGSWVNNRGVREQVVILDKGAHTPHCNPQDLTSQFLISLDRLGTDYVDIYMMHRDNPAIPAGEFIEELNEHLRAGRMRAFGGSNWSLPRVQEANEYAAAKGLVGFSAVSNNFSLARMVDPVWGGCISASDPASRAWLTEHQLPILPWSSQARGFFVRVDPKITDPAHYGDEELSRCWFSPDNFVRLERVQQMAKERNVLPINIALAYVLNQPFPTFPLIGPRIPSELHTSLPGLDIELTAEELKWLNGED